MSSTPPRLVRSTDDTHLTISTPAESITLTAEQVVVLWNLLGDVHVPQMSFPELQVSTDPAAGTGSTVCPHCEHSVVFDYGDAVVEVDAAVRWNGGTFVEHAEDGTVLHISQEDGEFRTMYHRCTSCGQPVTLPPDVDTIWS